MFNKDFDSNDLTKNNQEGSEKKENLEFSEGEATLVENQDPDNIELTDEDFDAPIYDDKLNTSLTEDEINDLDVDEIDILMQKIDVEIEEYENIFVNGEMKGKTYEEICEDGYNDDEYLRLKALNKKLQKNKKAILKARKEKGFFSNVPTVGLIMFIVTTLLTIVPVVPYLPWELAVVFAQIIGSITTNSKVIFILIPILYDLIFLIVECIYLLKLYKKGNDSIDKFRNFKSMLVLVIVNFIVMIPGIIIVISNVK